jgi:hypothetical protein
MFIKSDIDKTRDNKDLRDILALVRSIGPSSLS